MAAQFGLGAEMAGGAAATAPPTSSAGAPAGFGLSAEMGSAAPRPAEAQGGYGLSAEVAPARPAAAPSAASSFGLVAEATAQATAQATAPPPPPLAGPPAGAAATTTAPPRLNEGQVAETVALARARIGHGGGYLVEGGPGSGIALSGALGAYGDRWRSRLRELYARPRVAALAAPQALPTPLAHNKVASNVVLQQLLTYHVYYSIAWAVFMFHQVVKRHWRFSGAEPGIHDRDEIRSAGVALWLVFEPLRLYWGFVGNLRESPPAIVAFLIVTFFPCTPVCLYLLFDQRSIEPIDKAVNTATLCMLAGEVCAGVIAMYGIVKTQAEQFLVQEARLRAEGRL